MGLGIAIAKRLVMLSGGTFSIDSVPGTGTTITIAFSAARSAAAA
jgi:signal transduction histidine kinase